MRELDRDDSKGDRQATTQPAARINPPAPAASSVLALQTAGGNAAVTRLLAPPPIPPAVGAALRPATPSRVPAPEVAMPPPTALSGGIPVGQPVLPAFPAPTVGQQHFLTNIAAAHAEAVSRLSAATDQQIATLSAGLASQRQVVDQTLDSALGQVRAGSATATEQVTAEVAATDAALDPAVAGERARLDAWNQTAAADAGVALRERQDRVTSVAQERATTARTAAAQTADQGVQEAATQAQAALDLGQSKAAAAPSEEQEARSAQSAASTNLGQDSATKITQSAADAAGVLRGQGEEVAGAVQNIASTVTTDLGGHLGGIVDHLGRQAATAASTLDTSVTRARTTLADQRDAALGAVAQAEQQAVTGLRQEAARRHAALTEVSEQAVTQLRDTVAETVQQSETAVAQASAFAMSQPLSAQSAAQLTESARQQLTAGFDPVMTGLTQRGLEVQDGLGTMTSDATTSLTGVAAQSETGLLDVAGQSTTATRQVGSQTTGSLTASVDQATTAGDTAVTSFASTLDEHVDSAVPALDDLLDQHRGSLDNQIGEVRDRTAEPTGTLESRIDAAHARAAERAERSWIGNQLHDLWETVSSPEFLVGLVVGLAVATIIILSAGTATPFVIMAAGVAAGAAGAATGTMVGNARAGRDLTDNLLRNTIYGAAAGAVGAGVYLFGAGVVAGLGLTGGAAVAGGFIVLEASAIASNTVANVLAGRPWDENLLTAMLLAPLIELIQARFGPKGEPAPIEERPPVPGEEPVPSGDRDGTPIAEEDGPTRRGRGEPEGPEGVTDEDVHIEDAAEPARDPAEPQLDPAICFAAGTPVHTPNGPRSIEDIAVGGKVHAYDLARRRLVTREVTAINRGSSASWAVIRLRRMAIRSTRAHRFWVESLEDWVLAEDLTAGMKVLLADGTIAEIDDVELVTLPDRETTYNLSVEDAENYFVGEHGVLVHNVTRSRMTYLSRPGYRNYVLRNRAGVIYYSGMFGPNTTQADVEARHAANRNRYNPRNGDTFELMPGEREYGAARLVEQRRAIRNRTIIGRDGENYRGNRQDPLAEGKMADYLEYEQVKRGCG